MVSKPFLRLGCLATLGWLACQAQAESLASSASSAGSASSGSVSTSLQKSSHSSTGDDRRTEADFRIVEVAAVAERPGFARITMQGEAPRDTLVLELPQGIVERQHLQDGLLVHARRQVYGQEFSRADTREAFYLVLDDDWAAELAARPVAL